MYMILYMGYMVIIHLNVMLKDIILGHHGTTHWAFLTVTSPWQILDLHGAVFSPIHGRLKCLTTLPNDDDCMTLPDFHRFP